MKINRRSLLKTAAAGAALAGIGPRQISAGTPGFPMGSLDAHVKMRCSLSGDRTYWYYSGTVFGNVLGQATQPMLGVEGISFSLLDKLPEGRFRYTLTEAGYYLDLATQSIKDQVVNPFTGERYRPVNYLSTQRNILGPDLSVKPEMERPLPGLDFRGEITPVRSFKDIVWSAEDLFLRLPLREMAGDSGQPAFRVQTSLATLTADRRDVLDPDLDFVACQLNYQTLATWREWMGMGKRPGMISWRMVGTKCTVDELPGHLVERISKDHKGFFDG